MTRLAIYLAGGITGLSREEAKGWRNDFRKKYGEKYEVRDPFGREDDYTHLTGRDRNRVIAYGERRDILNCDATIARLDPVSMGTAMGIMYGFLSGRTVVVITSKKPENLSPMVLYHTHKVCDSIANAVDFIEKRHSRSTIKTIINRAGEKTEWDPSKIENAIRKAIKGISESTANRPNVNQLRADKLVTTVIMQLEDALEAKRLPYDQLGIEDIQNMVEKVLMDNGHRDEVHTLAKEYIKYRWKRELYREKAIDDSDAMKTIKDMLHDIKAPTGNIGRYTDWIRTAIEEENKEDVLNYLGDIEKNQMGILKTIYHHRAQTEDKYKKTSIDIRRFVKEFSGNYGHGAVTIENMVPDGLVIEIQRDTMRVILTNLIENSIKHGFRGGRGTVCIRGEPTADGKVLIEYWNDGKPMSSEEAERIFSGRQNEYSEEGDFQHGLSQVHRYIDQLRGTIECVPMKASGGEGYVPAEMGIPFFKITVPAAAGPAARALNTILVADDVESDRNMMRTILVKAGFEVVEASTIDRALEIVQSEHLCGAVLDVDFKEKDRDGLWLLKEIRAVKPDLRVVVVSGSDSGAEHRDWQAEARQSGAAEAFDKAQYAPRQISMIFQA